jgi:MFS family permease
VDGGVTTVVADPAPRRVSRVWVSTYSLAWLGLWMAYLVPQQFALLDQLGRFDPEGKVGDFGLINAVCGVVMLIALPLFGALCDRTRSRFGRRRVWMAGGVLVFASGLVATGLQTNWVGAGLAWLVSSIGFTMATTGFTALIADEVPDSQRGSISSAMYGPQALGVVLGLFSLTSIQDDLTRYLVLAVAVLALAAPFVLRHRDVVTGLPTGRITVRSVLGLLWVDPRGNPGYAWTFGSRLLVNLANVLATSYLLYFLRDRLRVADPDGELLVLTLMYLAWTVISTYGCGALSDRLGRRRVFVAGGAAVQALGCAVLALAPGTGTALVAAALFGIGYGAYMAVDQVMITQVLPEAQDRAKDLGIMNIGMLGPQTLGPLAAGLVISVLGGYQVLFALAGLTSLLGALMIYRVSSVR